MHGEVEHTQKCRDQDEERDVEDGERLGPTKAQREEVSRAAAESY